MARLILLAVVLFIGVTNCHVIQHDLQQNMAAIAEVEAKLQKSYKIIKTVNEQFNKSVKAFEIMNDSGLEKYLKYIADRELALEKNINDLEIIISPEAEFKFYSIKEKELMLLYIAKTCSDKTSNEAVQGIQNLLNISNTLDSALLSVHTEYEKCNNLNSEDVSNKLKCIAEANDLRKNMLQSLSPAPSITSVSNMFSMTENHLTCLAENIKDIFMNPDKKNPQELNIRNEILDEFENDILQKIETFSEFMRKQINTLEEELKKEINKVGININQEINQLKKDAIEVLNYPIVSLPKLRTYTSFPACPVVCITCKNCPCNPCNDDDLPSFGRNRPYIWG